MTRHQRDETCEVTSKRQRFDVLVQERYPQYSRNQIQSWIMQGKILVNEQAVTKSGTMVAPDAVITIVAQEPKFVSRAGFKLEKALHEFSLDVTGLVALDAGISTGGFTDCLLQHGVKRVYGVDVGYGQVHEKIRTDPRVVVMERTNVRYLTQLPEPVDLVTLDLSFISVLKVMDAVVAVLKPRGYLIVLIKPQFEAGRDQVARGGIVKDPLVHQAVVNTVVNGIVAHGFIHTGTVESPITGADGNKEFLACFTRV